MSEFPKVSVVIMNWNGKHFLEQFLPSVLASTYPNMELVVGDNASTDDSLDFLRTRYPQVKIVSNDRNYGYAGGYNQVINQLDAEYFVLLNSDAEVAPYWIEPVIQLMESDLLIAAAQPKVLSWHQKGQFEYAGAAGGLIDLYGYPFCYGRIFDSIEEDKGQYAEVKEIFWASGAALFIRSSCWKLVKGFDERFFAHMEEIDLCWRLKNMGYKVMYCPDSVVYHVGGGTLNADNPYKTYLNFRNNLFMLKKNLPASRAIWVIFIRIWLDFLSLIRYFIQGKPALGKSVSKAHRHFFRDFSKHQSYSSQNNFNSAGLYKGSIVWEYFFKKKKEVSELTSW